MGYPARSYRRSSPRSVPAPSRPPGSRGPQPAPGRGGIPRIPWKGSKPPSGHGPWGKIPKGVPKLPPYSKLLRGLLRLHPAMRALDLASWLAELLWGSLKNPFGWEVILACGGGGIPFQAGSTCGTLLFLKNGAPPPTVWRGGIHPTTRQVDFAPYVLPGFVGVDFGSKRETGTIYRAPLLGWPGNAWQAPRWDPSPADYYPPMPQKIPAPWVWPALDPEALPPGMPQGDPQPIPYPAIPNRPANDPERVPGYRPERGPVPGERPNWGGEPSPGPRFPLPGTSPQPGTPWTPEPAPPPPAPIPPSRFELVPGAAPKPLTGRHRRRPPGKNEGEKKTSKGLTLPQGGLATVFNGITESDDAIRAVFDALPWHIRQNAARQAVRAGERFTRWHRLGALAKHYKTLDMAKVVQNLVEESITDVVYARKARLERRRRQHAFKKYGIEGPYNPNLLWKGPFKAIYG